MEKETRKFLQNILFFFYGPWKKKTGPKSIHPSFWQEFVKNGIFFRKKKNKRPLPSAPKNFFVKLVKKLQNKGTLFYTNICFSTFNDEGTFLKNMSHPFFLIDRKFFQKFVCPVFHHILCQCGYKNFCVKISKFTFLGFWKGYKMDNMADLPQNIFQKYPNYVYYHRKNFLVTVWISNPSQKNSLGALPSPPIFQSRFLSKLRKTIWFCFSGS